MARNNVLKRSLVLAVAVFGMICMSTSLYPQVKLAFYTDRTLSLPAKSVVAHLTTFGDSLAGDTVYQVLGPNGYPVSYHRKIKTSVCFDNKCRLLNIVVHWNITGRYLGFELPMGEFLSKAEHTPFTHSEYIRLHSLLTDPNSPLANISYNELAPVQREISADIDAVSSPTSKNLLEFVVEGAAYTTYKLWHIIYGGSMEEISQLTVDALTPELLLMVLQSPDVTDKIWALRHKRDLMEASPVVRKTILALVASSQFSLAESAVDAIDSVDMKDEGFQLGLIGKLDDVNYSLKKDIIQKFIAVDGLSKTVATSLAEKLAVVNGELVGSILYVFSEKKNQSVELLKYVAKLLEHPNVFISRQAFEFLKGVAIEDQNIVKAIETYRTKHNL